VIEIVTGEGVAVGPGVAVEVGVAVAVEVGVAVGSSALTVGVPPKLIASMTSRRSDGTRRIDSCFRVISLPQGLRETVGSRSANRPFCSDCQNDITKMSNFAAKCNEKRNARRKSGCSLTLNA
jgi:hypothetical protein